jgi:hypothetical protein
MYFIFKFTILNLYSVCHGITSDMTFLFLYELLYIYQVLMYPGHNAVVYFK